LGFAFGGDSGSWRDYTLATRSPGHFATLVAAEALQSSGIQVAGNLSGRFGI
jgi:hypothetical protein